MADPQKRLAGNADGDFFVDSSCENLDICRQLAPDNFTYWENYAAVGKQPENDEELKKSLQAVVCCPVGAIGVRDRSSVAQAMQDFPMHLDGPVYYMGFNTMKTSGGNPYFAKHPQGNWLLNTAKYVPTLIKKLEELGGVRYIFISHRDDQGESKKYAEHFGSQRIIHKEELEAQPDAEIVLNETQPVQFNDDVLIIPTPGHTEGHLMLLFANQYLFSGDSLYFDRKEQRLEIWNPLWTWFSYEKQIESIASLLPYEFDWLLPVHGQRVHLGKQEMKKQLTDAIDRGWRTAKEKPSREAKLRNLRYYGEELRKLGQCQYARIIEERAKLLSEPDI